MTAVMVSTFSIKNVEKFKQYISKTREVAAPHGAEMMFHGTLARALNGDDSNADRAVIVRFPDADALNAWFGSPEYQRLVPLREEAADMKMLSYEPVS